MEHLKLLRSIEMDASGRPECLNGTREDVLAFITGWLTTPSESQNVLWLQAVAGFGKSTISTTVAEYFRDIGRLGGFVFFDRNDATHSDPNAFVRTLAHQLAAFDPHIRSAICSQIEQDSRIAEAPMHRQFSKLLLDPLKSVEAFDGPIIIVIDALDECGDATSRRDLLALLEQELAKFPPAFRILITSRAESDITAALSRQPNIVPHELSITTDSNNDDVILYLLKEMVAIRRRHFTFDLPYNWPGESTLRELVRRSAGLFIWATLACNFISEGHDPHKQLEIILSSGSYGSAETRLDKLYSTALNAAGKWDDATFSSDFRLIMGAVLRGRISLSDENIDQILGLEGRRAAKHIFSRVRCLLVWQPGQAVRILHASFGDYLTDPNRSGQHPWYVDLITADYTLACGCFRVMKAGLRFNICGLETSYLSNENVPNLSSRIESSVPVHLAYSCRFWADHLQNTSEMDGTAELRSNIEEFLYDKLLYWLEVLSLLNHVSLAPSALLRLGRWSSVSQAVMSYRKALTFCIFSATMQTLI